MDVHAQSLAANFAKIREEQFSCVLHNLEHVLGESVTPQRQSLGGEADLALKGFQFLLLLEFMQAHDYVSLKDIDIFNGMVMHHGWDSERDAVRDYCLAFSASRADATAQIVQVAIPITDYFLEDQKDPRAWLWLDEPSWCSLHKLNLQLQASLVTSQLCNY